MGLLEVVYHVLNEVLNGNHLLLNILDLVILLLHLSIHLIDLLAQPLSNDLLLLVGHSAKLLVSLDLSLDILVLLFDHVNLRVQHVHIVVEGVVLLISLDESGHNFLDRANTRLLLDLVEGILDDIDISNIHIHQILLFFVVVGPLLQSKFEEGGGVGEFT